MLKVTVTHVTSPAGGSVPVTLPAPASPITLEAAPHLHVTVGGGHLVSLSSQGPWACSAPNCTWTGKLPVPAGKRLPALRAVVRIAANEHAVVRVELLGQMASGRSHACGLVLPRFREFGSPIVTAIRVPGGCGYWLVSANGGVFTYGRAHFYGSVVGVMDKLHRRFSGSITAAAATPDGRGYWLVSARGGVFAFGDAHFYGSLRELLQREHRRLNRPVIAVKPMPDGNGYWLVAKDGGVFAFPGRS